MKPLIGIFCEFEEWHPKPGFESSYLKLYHHYYHAITRAGGLAVAVPVFEDPSLALELLPRFDGVLLTGGDDLPSVHFGEELHPASRLTPPWREEQELLVARQVLHNSNQPVLAICLGMQSLALAAGGRIIQDIPTQHESAIEHRGGVMHEIAVDTGSRLEGLFGRKPTVNSYHHQGVASAGDGLRVVAEASDGVMEAVEGTSESRFLMAVQWHPESQLGHQPSLDLFRAFVAACGQ